MSYDYKKNNKYKQKRKICTKNYAGKRCPPNHLNIKLITKNNKIFVCFFAINNIGVSNDAHYCDTVKRKQKPAKMGQICKSRENWFL